MMPTAAQTVGTFGDAFASPQIIRQNRQRGTSATVNETVNNHDFFTGAVSRLMDRLYAAALRFTRNPADAEDLIAESLEKAWLALDSLEDRARFDGWMMRILSNA